MQSSSESPVAWPVGELARRDLAHLLEVGLQRGAHLLSAGELLVLERMRSIDEPAGRLYARLSARKPDVFAMEKLELAGLEIPVAAERLVRAGLLDRLVPWSVRASRMTRAELVVAARGLGLSTRGRRDAIQSRLLGHTGFCASRWIRVRHKALLRRLVRWALLDAHADRSTLVIDRMGVVRYPRYVVTPGRPLHADRRELLAWERLHRGPRSVDDALRGLAAGEARAPGRLDLRRRLFRGLIDAAEALERDGRLAEARHVYQSLLAGGHVELDRVAVRFARVEERLGGAAEALSVLRRARHAADPVRRIGIGRAGRRVARQLRVSWRPPRPIPTPPRRTLWLPRGHPVGGRPTWCDGHTVERAVVARLAEVGRRALHVEGGLWRTLRGLLFRDAFFLPVTGALPMPYLSGPLDLGTRGFVERREDAVEEVFLALVAGEGPDRLRRAIALHAKERLAGVDWRLTEDPELLPSVVGGLGGAVVGAVLRPLLETRGAAAGLPDLVILPGPPAKVQDAIPARLSSGAMLVEVKGPTDTVRDAQAVWFGRLLDAGATVEVWEVRPRGKATTPSPG